MRRAIWGVAGMVGVVMVGLLAAVVAGGGKDSEGVATVAASGGSQVAAPPSAPAAVPAPTSTTTVPATSSTKVALALVTTVPPTTRPIPTTTTTLRLTPTSPAPPTSVAVTPSDPATTTTTSNIVAGLIHPPGPGCASSMFSATVTMSKPTYGLGEPVQATSTFRNVSGQTCYWLSNAAGFDILDASGASVAIPAVRIADGFEPVAFPAGEALTETWTWDQNVCRGTGPCVPATPGHYTFVVNNRPYGSGRAPFDITA